MNKNIFSAVFFICLSVSYGYAQPGIISTIAGVDTAGYGGDGGPATLAGITTFPGNVAVDMNGNIYISDQENSRIRKITSSTGVITTIVNGNDLSTSLIDPKGVAVDTFGNIYIADDGGYTVKEIKPSGIVISRYAGNGTAGYSGDGGNAHIAELGGAGGIALDRAGDLYIADEWNHCIRKVNSATGIITTIAGNGTRGYAGDEGAATSAHLSYPTSVAVDLLGNVYIADNENHCIRMVDTSGIISTIAGNGTPGFMGDGGAATAAELYNPNGVTVDAVGNVYIADQNNQRIREVNCTTGTIATIAGNGTIGFSGDDGSAAGAQMYFPASVTLDAAGNLYIADQNNNRIRKIAQAANAVAIVSKTDETALYPNPTMTSLTVLSTDQLINSLTITNILGQTVYNTNSCSKRLQIAVSEFPAGVYFVKINGSEVRKFLKE